MIVSQEAPPTRDLRQRIGLWLGPLAFVLILALTEPDMGNPMVGRMMAITAWMAIWWISEAIPIPATSLMPLVLFPALGIMPMRPTAGLEGVVQQYLRWVSFLLLGGFLIAIALQKWNLHKRFALQVLRLMGNRPATIVLGFMIAAAFLSMWLSNTATTMMLLPIALSILFFCEESHDFEEDAASRNFSLALLLGLAYAASIGGMATLIGTPPNAILVAQFEQLFPQAPSISFASWTLMALPFSLVFLACAWVLLTRILFRLPHTQTISSTGLIQQQLRELGPMHPEEKRVLVIFVILVTLWFTRKERLFGSDVDLYGWSYYLDAMLARFDIDAVGYLIDDGTIAIFMALWLFLLPASSSRGHLLEATDLEKVPWGVLLLFGGGLALAKGFAVSGLSGWTAGQFEVLLQGRGALEVVVSIAAFITSLTELTSNTATTSTAIPIMAALAQGIGANPLLLLIPTALTASCAFMLPIATPPNAIVYGSGRVPITKMLIAGFWLDILSVLLATALVFTLGNWVFDLLGPMPLLAQT